MSGKPKHEVGGEFLATNPDKLEKAAFQKRIASEVLQTLKGIQ